MLQSYVSSRLARVVAWSCVAVLIYLSLVPQQMEIRTGFPGDFEHLIAYAGTAGALGLAYPSRTPMTIALSLAIFSCALELMQGYVPGRTALVTGALASGAGAAVGAFVAAKLVMFDAMWANARSDRRHD